MATQRAYRRSSKAAAVAFVLVTLYTVTSKLLQGRLGHDWAHSLLYLGSAVLAAYAGWLAARAWFLDGAWPGSGALWARRPLECGVGAAVAAAATRDWPVGWPLAGPPPGDQRHHLANPDRGALADLA
jgi:hypothetical protein